MSHFKGKQLDRLRAQLHGKDKDKKDNNGLGPLANSGRVSKKKDSKTDRSAKLRAEALERLESSKFRSMNEYLYTNNSRSGSQYMDRDSFQAYHEAYEKIVEAWPSKPVDFIIKYISSNINSWGNRGKPFTIVDLGCGSKPKIKNGLAEGKVKRVTVKSFDLVSTHPDVTVADISALPIANSSADCAVFCLSLMGTNLRDFILEANRVLKTNGQLLICEVVSRFEGSEKEFIKKLAQFYGFKSTLKEPKVLEPGNYFVFFHFRKVKNLGPDRRELLSNQYAEITLKSCQYKAR